ncbi:MAG TPA: LysR substrate-binding domain-containing protein [Myxococcales bacterium]|nr:LysR substrate-binding domain-containing protein [Myxococcales bacterium]
MNLNALSFSLRQLQYVVALAELLSFRKAAEQCHVSQPSLSAQIAQLEEALGVRLFERSHRRVIITSHGEDLIARARLILRDTEDLVESARRATNPLEGTLRVGVIPTVSPYLLPSLMRFVRRAFPRLSVRWSEEKTDVLTRWLASGRLDASLLALEAEIGDVEREVIGRDPFILALPRGHPLAMPQVPATVGGLRGATVLLLEEGHCFREQVLATLCGSQTREFEFRATSLATLVQMVASGAGVTLLPTLAAPIEMKSAPLVARRFAPPAPHRTVGLVWRKRSPCASAFRELAATMREGYPLPA